MVDEHGGLQGIVTQTDLLEAIAGDLPEASAPEVKEMEDGALLIDGAMSVYDAKVRLGLTESPDGNFNTFAGFVLSIFGRIPSVGERTAWQDWSFEIAEIDGWRIGAVLVRRKISDKPSEERAGS